MIDYKKKYLKYKIKYLKLQQAGSAGFTMYNKDFSDHMKALNINDYILEGCPMFNFQISELKSSFLVRDLLINSSTNEYITKSYIEFINNLYNYLSINFDEGLDIFLNGIYKVKIVYELYNEILKITLKEKNKESISLEEHTYVQSKIQKLISSQLYIGYERYLGHFEEYLSMEITDQYWNDISFQFQLFYKKYFQDMKIFPVSNIFTYYDITNVEVESLRKVQIESGIAEEEATKKAKEKFLIIFKKYMFNDFYVLYSFNYWTWKKYYIDYIDFFKDKYTNQNFSTNLFINLGQQKINEISNLIRGFRKTYSYSVPDYLDDATTVMVENVHNKDKILTNNIGISNILYNSLERAVQGRKIPWLHAGTKNCRTTLNGAYGQILIKNFEENSYYASYQCSISGSCNFTYFPFLISLLNIERNLFTQTDNYYEDMFNFIIICATLSMVGDGGHNFREVLFGLLISNTGIYYYIRYLIEEIIQYIAIYGDLKQIFIDDIEEALKLHSAQFIDNFITCFDEARQLDDDYKLLKKIITEIKAQKPDSLHINGVITEYIRNMIKIYPIVNYFYEYTKDINFISITQDDIDTLPSKFIQEFDSKNWFKSHMTDYIRDPFIAYDKDAATSAQYFFAIDSDRYLQTEEDWENCVDNIWENILSKLQFYPTYDDFKSILEKCEKDLDVNTIPFA